MLTKANTMFSRQDRVKTMPNDYLDELRHLSDLLDKLGQTGKNIAVST